MSRITGAKRGRMVDGRTGIRRRKIRTINEIVIDMIVITTVMIVEMRRSIGLMTIVVIESGMSRGWIRTNVIREVHVVWRRVMTKVFGISRGGRVLTFSSTSMSTSTNYSSTSMSTSTDCSSMSTSTSTNCSSISTSTSSSSTNMGTTTPMSKFE